MEIAIRHKKIKVEFAKCGLNKKPALLMKAG